MEIAVFEVERPKRRHLRHEAKSDLRDAASAEKREGSLLVRLSWSLA